MIFCKFLPHKILFCWKVHIKNMYTFYLKNQKYSFCALIFHPLSETESYWIFICACPTLFSAIITDYFKKFVLEKVEISSTHNQLFMFTFLFKFFFISHYPILDTRISGLWTLDFVTLVIPLLDFATAWTGEL